MSLINLQVSSRVTLAPLSALPLFTADLALFVCWICRFLDEFIVGYSIMVKFRLALISEGKGVVDYAPELESKIS